jgi:hypothetical protein
MFELKLEGLEEASARLESYPAALGAALDAKATELATALVDLVRNDKLSGGVLSVGSGALRDSIAASISSDSAGVVASVGSTGDVKYAAIQEYGGKTSAHEVLPVKAQALAFVAGGGQRFAVRVEHPGSLIPVARRHARRNPRRAGRRRSRRMGARMTREAAFSALFAAVSSAYPWGLASLRMKLWSEVPVRCGQRSSSSKAGRKLTTGPHPQRRKEPSRPSSSSISTPATRRPRARPPSTMLSTRSTPRWLPPPPTWGLGAKPLGARSMTARSWACRSATRATSMGTGLR